MKFSKKQLDYLVNSTHDINLATGSIRSGKTYIQMIRFHEFLCNEALANVDCLISAKKGEGAYRNIIRPFLEIMNENGEDVYYDYTNMPRRLVFKPKNIICYIEGANDDGSEARIRGMTAQAWLADEITLYPRNFFMQGIGRCSAGKRYKFFTCNPDSPSHYINTEVINNTNIDKKVWNFSLNDNPALDPQYVKQLEGMYSGVFRERFIEGKWVIAEGVIFNTFSREKHIVNTLPTNCKEVILGVDWGWNHPMAMVLIVIDYDGKFHIIDELYLKEQQVDKSLGNILLAKGWNIVKIGNQEFRPYMAYADSARPDNINAFRTYTNITCVPANKKVIEGIQFVQQMFTKNNITINSKCVNLIRELESYSWKTKGEQSEDEPVKENDDVVDALRYALFTKGYSSVRLINNNPFARHNGMYK